MGMAGIKWWPCLSTRPSFSVNINEEAFLKVSFKNIDWFQIWKNYFFQKGPKNKQILKNLKFFFAFLFAFSMDFSMVYCLFSYSQWFFLHFNFTAVSSQLATTVVILFIVTLSYDNFILKIKNRFPIFGYMMHFC